MLLESQYPHVKRSLQQGEACLLQWSNLSVGDGTALQVSSALHEDRSEGSKSGLSQQIFSSVLT